MFTVGKSSVKAQRLIDVTFEAMWRGIRMVKPGVTLGDIGHAIQSYAEGERFSVVRDFVGTVSKVFPRRAQCDALWPSGRGRRFAGRYAFHN